MYDQPQRSTSALVSSLCKLPNCKLKRRGCKVNRRLLEVSFNSCAEVYCRYVAKCKTTYLPVVSLGSASCCTTFVMTNTVFSLCRLCSSGFVVRAVSQWLATHAALYTTHKKASRDRCIAWCSIKHEMLMAVLPVGVTTCSQCLPSRSEDCSSFRR